MIYDKKLFYKDIKIIVDNFDKFINSFCKILTKSTEK